MFKPFFFHYNKAPGKLPNKVPRGFTVHFKPSDVSQRHVWMSVAWCNPKDEFNKKIGRETALQKDYKLVLIRMVPGLIVGCVDTCNADLPWHLEGQEPNYYWIYKYFL